MAAIRVCLFAVVSFAASVSAGALPSFINACSASDPELNLCLERAVRLATPKFTDGIPSLGIARLDPVDLGTVDVDNPSLRLKFTNTTVFGLKGARINSYKLNKDTGKAALDFTANVTLKAHYDMDGQVLILPIRGNGQARIKITNLNIVVKYNYETKNGHWVVTNYKDTYKMDRAQFKFTNLFGGNKELADLTSRFANENWEIIITEIGGPTIGKIIAKCVGEVIKLFRGVPVNQLLLN